MVGVLLVGDALASMKALPKRKGNSTNHPHPGEPTFRLNESPSEKEGKLATVFLLPCAQFLASMKALPKRKGNPAVSWVADKSNSLNESPSEKEGKPPRSY